MHAGEAQRYSRPAPPQPPARPGSGTVNGTQPRRAESWRPRLYLDISTLLRWSGPPVGILRMEAELARYAAGRPEAIGCVFFDPVRNHYRLVHADAARDLLAGKLAIDTSHVPDPRPVRRSLLPRLAEALAQQLYLVRRPRRFLIINLELMRLRLRPGMLRRSLEALQARLFSRSYRMRLIDEAGNRRAFLPLARVLGERVELGPETVIVSGGADWNTRDAAAMAALRSTQDHRQVRLCHDLIPIKFPHYFIAQDVAMFTQYMRAALHFVDRFVCISECTARDLEAFARQHGIARIDVRVEPLGADPVAPADTAGALPDGLAPRKFVLFVSTIEPRKNHALLHRVWLRLLDQGIPQAAGCKLVFVGRVGWNMDALVQDLAHNPRLQGNLLHLQDLPDGVLAALYREAAFCVYPSLYEGFGLPVLEAFSHGRAVIGSTGGALPEVMRDFGPLLDPEDEEAWTETMAQWITRPEIVAAHEARLADFRPTSWPEAARRYFERAAEPFSA